MKKFLLILALICMALPAVADNVTFDLGDTFTEGSTGANAKPFECTKTPITMSVLSSNSSAKAGLTTTSYGNIRFYGTTTVTFKCEGDYAIDNVTLSAGSSNNAFKTSDGATFENCALTTNQSGNTYNYTITPTTGNEKEFSFTVTSQMRLSSVITVNYSSTVSGGKKNAGLSFKPETVNCFVGEMKTVTFSYSTDATITYENSDPTVAEYEDGIVYAYKVGSCTITASSIATDEYNEGEATLTINVTEAPQAVMIVAQGKDGNYYAMSSDSFSAVKVGYAGGKAVVAAKDNKLLWIVADGAVQSVALKEADQKSYISFSKTTVSFAATAPSGQSWAVNSNGYLECSGRAFIIRDDSYFKTYDVSNIFKDGDTYGGAGVPMEYVIAPAVEVAAGDYVSFSSDKAVAVPEGITAYYLSSVTATDATLTAFEGVIPANAGVILRNEGEEAVTFYVVESTATPASLDGNLLVATDGSTVAEGNYILAQPAGKEIGFYPLDADYALAAGHAYLPASAVPSTPSGIKIKFGESGVADIVVEGEGDGQMYNMLGQKVNANYKGIVIKNGKKYINK